MPEIENIQSLKDLGEIIARTKADVRNFARPAEFEISNTFAEALKAAFSDYTIEFYERTVSVTTPIGQRIYVSGQSFALAVCLMDFCEEIGRYRALAYQILNRNQEELADTVHEQGRLDDKVFTALRDASDQRLTEMFKVKANEFFLLISESENTAEKNTNLLIRFLTDYSWWLGGKQISRNNDWCISPVSTLLNMPQNDSNFIARAVSRATDDARLRDAFKQAVKHEWNIDAEIDKPVVCQEVVYNTGYQSAFERNRILFGAPGTGKSFTVNKEAKELIGADNERDYERVTFHPDYSYANFVGTYKPVPCKDSEGKDAITYAYVPGPFMRVYVKALKNSREKEIKPFLLIIEEINRANVSAVFGDIFQLLDRGNDGVSEYPIQASEDIKKYLVDELGGQLEDYKKIRIPDNMFIWATMNSADQGVFPMDTAFKRRWDFTYLGINDSDEDIRGKYVYLADDRSQKVEWNKLRKAINNFLAKEKINEDKQLGPYFISRSIVVPEIGDEIDRDKFISVFKNKVIMYLFEDAARQKQSKLFEGCFSNASRYSEICWEFEAKGIGIFCSDIQIETEPEEPSINFAETE